MLGALDLVSGVRPLIATVAVEEPPDALPDPGWQAATGLLSAGWVDVERCSAVRRLRFERLAESGLAVPYGGGLAWGLTAVVRPEDAARAAGIGPWVAAAAAYEAWTGRAADLEPDLPPPSPDEDPAAPVPQVWWWSQGEDPATVRSRVAGLLPEPVEARVDTSGDPGWQAVIADLERGEAAAGLELLRSSVAGVRPSWAALQPAGGLAVPGMDPDLPMTGVLVNPWVSREWAGDALPRLDRALSGAHREELGDGVLWVTDPRLADVPDAVLVGRRRALGTPGRGRRDPGRAGPPGNRRRGRGQRVGHPAPVHFVGVDLAWGGNKPTGLAVLDDSGVLVHVCAVRTDEQIAEELAPYTSGDCLVAIDAPLIVRNATGNRPAEAALNRDFAPFDAGAHPANTSKPEFAGTTRGARVSALLGLDMNPTSRRRRRAIEVYPHPATVALFRLGRTLKYKNKPGRDFATLRNELLVLIGLIEGLDAAEPRLVVDAPGSRWPALRAAVEDAARKSELRTVEDQVDAVVCAYVALLAVREPKSITVYGDFADGYIVTPTLPEGHRPSPRPKRATATPGGEPAALDASPAVPAVVREYSDRHEALTQAGAGFVALVTSILDDAGINYLSVTGRTKSVASFAAKAARRQDGELLHPDPMRDITDQLGVRVITYVLSDVTVVADLMADQVVVRDDRDLGRETASQGRFGYASRHLVIALDAARESHPAYTQLRGLVASVQIRTVLQHAWAEFEHDIRYKGTVPAEHAPDFDRRFTLAAGLLELADREFSTIRDRLRIGPPERSEPEDDDPRIDPRELAAFLAGQYADAGWSRTDHYAWISGLLLELTITSLDELGDVLRPIDELDLNARMDYRYPPGAVRRLDDALLAAFGRRYIDLRGNEHRIPALRARLERLTGDDPPPGQR